jgi:hypothetical protein
LLPTKPADLPEVILIRNCWIEGPDGEVSPLKVQFLRPHLQEDGTAVASVRLSCKYFERSKKAYGVDELQAFVVILRMALMMLKEEDGDGYAVWHLRRGDLNFFDFWRGAEFEQEFCLPSAYVEAKRERFYAMTAGKFLTPSHRVGVEADRPAITIYRVREDGSDTLGSVIGPEEIKGHTWESLAQLVGERILWDSLEGIELMRALQPDRGPDPDDQPTNARSST